VLNFNNDPSLVTIRRSVIGDNVVLARSSTGTADLLGSGVFNNSLLEMLGVLLGADTGRADAPSGVAQGGGIWSGVDLSGPDVQLTLDHSALLGNRIAATAGITPQGGGLYTTTPATLTATRIAFNFPDQCVGCSPAMHKRSLPRVHRPPRPTPSL
jgi:hypothetical protein